MKHAGFIVRRFLGTLLVVGALLPGYWILENSSIGSFGRWVVTLESEAVDLMIWGSIIAVGCGVILATILKSESFQPRLDRLGRVLSQISPTSFAIGCGLLSSTLALVASVHVFQGLPTNVDSMATLLQARFMAEGLVSGPVPERPSFHLILNTLLTNDAWVSFYPPLHTGLLAVGLRLGAPHLVGPLLTGITVLATSRLAIEVFPERPIITRAGGLLAALSPFIVFLGASYLSHSAAAAGIAVLGWAVYRARDRHWIWAVIAGGAAGFAISARPWTGLVVSTGLFSALWLPKALQCGPNVRWLSQRLAAAAVGGVPFAAVLLTYNAYFFGDPFQLGYAAAYGPAHGLGFHDDPWGYPYGIIEAIGYTAADLTALSLHLLETPLPIVAVVGLYLALWKTVPREIVIFLLLATLPIVANFFYWHHGFQMGPRMLYESAPAWCILTVLAVAGIASRDAVAEAPARDFLSRVAIGSFIVALLGPAFLIPARVEANRLESEDLARMSIPSPPEEPALVFVHGSWSERISARLQASGIRLDSLEVALRRNDLCQVDAYTRARNSGTSLPDLDFQRIPGMPPDLRRVETSGGTQVRLDSRIPLSPTCRREMRADRFGTIPLAPLIWKGDLPGIERGLPLLVRDLGPEENQKIQAEHPDRTSYVYMRREQDGQPVLRGYEEAVVKLWGIQGGSGDG